MFHFPSKRSITSLEKLWLWRGWELWALWCRKGAVARHRKWVGPISQRSTFRFHLLRLDIFTRWASFQSHTPVHTRINRGFPNIKLCSPTCKMGSSRWDSMLPIQTIHHLSVTTESQGKHLKPTSKHFYTLCSCLCFDSCYFHVQ